MTHASPPLRRAIVGLLLTVALPATSALAQEATAPTAAPAPVEPPPPPVTITPPPAPPAAAATPPASSTTAVQPVLRNGVPVAGAATPEPAPQAEPAARPARRTVARERPAPRRRAAAPAAVATAPPPVEASAPAAVVAAPAPAAVEPIAPPAAAEPVAPAPAAVAPAAETAAPAQASSDRIPYWPLAALAAVAALGLIAFALRRRRRRREEELAAQQYEYLPVEENEHVAAEETFAEPVMAEPGAEPVLPRHDPVPSRVEPALGAAVGMAGAAALHEEGFAEAERPWLEFSMHPRRAGTSVDEALVEFELTVDNRGSAPASDVRIATWMFADGQLPASEMERLLIEPPTGSQSEPMLIQPGDSTQVEGAIALPKAALGGSVLPVVVADARYRLPDGSEGRTSMSFAVGLPSGDGLAPFAVDTAPAVHEDVAAREQELQRV